MRDLTQNAIALAPNAPNHFNEDGTLNLESECVWRAIVHGQAPMQNLFYTPYENKTTNVSGNAVISYNITKDLIIRSTAGYNTIHSDELVMQLSESTRPE